jgi:predicted kinase
MIVIFGLPGSGKSTLSKALAEKIEAVHLNTDMIRDQLGKRGLYSQADKENVYEHLLLRAEQELRQNHTVIVDATFTQEARRERFWTLASRLGIPIQWILMEASEDVIKKRVSKKRAFSEADFHVYKELLQTANYETSNALSLRSDILKLDELIECALGYIKGRNP